MQRNLARMVGRTVGTLAATGALAAVALCSPAAAAEFGIAAFDQQITANAAGASFSQAGGHPYDIITEIELNTYPDPELRGNAPRPVENARDIVTELPPGMFGNPAHLAQCTVVQLVGKTIGNEFLPSPECPVDSQLGLIELDTDARVASGIGTWIFPIFNMVPPANMPAAFGFDVAGIPIILTGNVRNGGDFGVDVGSNNISEAIDLNGVRVTFWGNPADPSHDFQRCLVGGVGMAPGAGTEGPHCDPESGIANFRPQPYIGAPTAFLTVPVSCMPPGVGMRAVVRADSWLHPGVFAEREMFSHIPPGFPLAPSEWGPRLGMVGCDLVPFNPSVVVEPTNHQADTPTGLNVDFRLPQEGLLNPQGIATADVKKTVVTLPPGIAVSPSAATGLEGCSLAEIGLSSGDEPTCPDGSKIGTVEIETPLMEVPLHGFIYLGRQSENPFGSLMAIYLVAKAHGVTVKLAGRVDLDPVTGRIVTTVENSPQLPFNDLRVDFKGGPRSPLVNPHTCGTYQATAEMTPWTGQPPANIASSFDITSGPGGGPCPNAQQFAPGFTIGTTDNQAAAFSPLSLTMSRADGDQQLGGVTIHTPTGLLGTVAAVALCGEPQASQGTCGPDSQIGTLTAGAGAGPTPFYVTSGRVYITGPYRGAPYGLSVVVPAKAGPFNLGTVVVRGTISVDPQTAALTVTTDPLPTILQGIPLDLRVINVSIDRPGFIFNPTNCNPQEISGTLTGGQGLVEPVRSSFQVTNCAILGFKPSFTVSTSGRTSRANGASLDARLSYPKGAFGKEANIGKVKVSLPRQLPSRLETLQKACPAETFQADPAACPQASKIGTATADTPVLPVRLSGPVYFVSHGGEAFPDLVVVLQGYNVTVDLVGSTFIDKAGITSTTFTQIPDVPVGTFELKLPQGKFSALAANGNLCNTTLTMPTLFIAQDGAVIKQATPIAVTGCKAKKARAAIRHRHRRNRRTHKHKKK